MVLNGLLEEPAPPSLGSFGVQDPEVPYVNTWFWPSFTLVGTSSLFFGDSASRWLCW